jgi:hypothetical protein
LLHLQPLQHQNEKAKDLPMMMMCMMMVMMIKNHDDGDDDDNVKDTYNGDLVIAVNYIKTS